MFRGMPLFCLSANVFRPVYGNIPHSWEFNTIWKNELRELSDTEFLLLQISECRQSKQAGMNCPASQGDKPRRGGGGLTPTGRNAPSVRRAAAIMPFCFPCGVVTTLLFPLRRP